MRKLLSWLRVRGKLQTLFTDLRARKASRVSDLYVMRVDFPLEDKELRERIEASLDPIKKKFGIDFIVLEPGIKLSRFDEI